MRMACKAIVKREDEEESSKTARMLEGYAVCRVQSLQCGLKGWDRSSPIFNGSLFHRRHTAEARLSTLATPRAHASPSTSFAMLIAPAAAHRSPLSHTTRYTVHGVDGETVWLSRVIRRVSITVSIRSNTSRAPSSYCYPCHSRSTAIFSNLSHLPFSFATSHALPHPSCRLASYSTTSFHC